MRFTWLLFLTSASLAVAQSQTASPGSTTAAPESAPATTSNGNGLNWSFLANALYAPLNYTHAQNQY